jgi:hypothetical protein
MAPDGGESVADVATRFSQFLSAAEMELHGYFNSNIEIWNISIFQV